MCAHNRVKEYTVASRREAGWRGEHEMRACFGDEATLLRYIE